jgi:hypothetical protein
MITDALSQGDLIAALHLESLFNSGQMPPVADDAVQLRRRLAFVEKLAVSAQGLSFKMGMATAAALRSAAIVADWRTYLPEDCVAAMIKDEWHWST